MRTVNKPVASPADHVIPNALLSSRVHVTVVGCGGTGSSIAAGLPYLHQAMLAFGHPHGLQVTFVDGDRISETNCVRQPFSITEVGQYKATVLATRINLFWGLGWKGSPVFLDESWAERTDILIGCVDSRKARQTILKSAAHWNCRYWLDIGNNADRGQFILGQPDNHHTRAEAVDKLRLPTVAELFPEITDPKLDKKDNLPSCSALEALQRQEPFINQTLAYQALGMLARLFRYGRLTYHGGFVNLASGRTSSLPIDPSIWKRMMTANRPRKSRKAV